MSTDLTDADRAEIAAARQDEYSLRRDGFISAFERGKAAGIAAERERCARICEEYAFNWRGIKGAGGRECAAAIRAQKGSE
jgi:hypothetical protein